MKFSTTFSLLSLAWLPLLTKAQKIDQAALKACLAADNQCTFLMDGICDSTGSPGDWCGAGQDCLDCAPVNCTSMHRKCGQCTSTPGCVYCAKDGLCSPMVLDQQDWDHMGKDSLCAAEDWKTTCDVEYKDNVFKDPDYDIMKWSYKLTDVEPVWKMGFTGKGVMVRVNDDGVDGDHPEFAGRYDLNMSCTDHKPWNKNDTHGTTVASLIAAGSDNNKCAVGMAPGASLSSCRIMGDNIPKDDDDRDNKSLLHKIEDVDISSNSYGVKACQEKKRRRHLQLAQGPPCPVDPNQRGSPCAPGGKCDVDGVLSPPCFASLVDYCKSPLNFDHNSDMCSDLLDEYSQCFYPSLDLERELTFEKGTRLGRQGRGTIFVFASGNERDDGSDSNWDKNTISRYTINVGGVGKRGYHASYSNSGANLLVSAPAGDNEYVSNNVVAVPSILGKGKGKECAIIGPGTSYAAPTVSGIIALMLEANPNLGWRDVQDIIARTSTQVDDVDPSWTTNGAGLHHSNKYGFGIINAKQAVKAAQKWINLGPELMIAVEKKQSSKSKDAWNIANDKDVTTSSVLEVKREDGDDDNFVVESVYLFLELHHGSKGDLQIELISPMGTVTEMTKGGRPGYKMTVEEDWQLRSVKSWGESPIGDWTLRIRDLRDHQEFCVDRRFVTADGFTCQDVTGAGLCKDGRPMFADADLLPDSQNVTTSGEACCSCGGGNPFGQEKLKSWKLEIYGHSKNNVLPVVVKPNNPTKNEKTSLFRGSSGSNSISSSSSSSSNSKKNKKNGGASRVKGKKSDSTSNSKKKEMSSKKKETKSKKSSNSNNKGGKKKSSSMMMKKEKGSGKKSTNKKSQKRSHRHRQRRLGAGSSSTTATTSP